MTEEQDPRQSSGNESLFGDQPKAESILGPLPKYRSILDDVEEPSEQEEVVEAEPVTTGAEPDSELSVRAPSEIITRLESAGRRILAVAVVLVPIAFDTRTVDAFNLAKLTILALMTLLAAGVLVVITILLEPWRSRRPPSFPKSWIVRLSLLLLALTTISTIFSASRAVSFFGLYHRYEGLVSLALYVAVLLLIHALCRGRPDALREIVVAVGAAAVIVAAYVFIQDVGLDFANWQQVTGSAPTLPIGNLGNAGLTGSFLGMAVPFVLYLVPSAASWIGRLAWTVGGVLIVVGLWATQSRPGVIGALFGIAALLLLVSTKIAPKQKLAVIAAGLLIGGLAPLFIPGVLGPRAPADLTVVLIGRDALPYRAHMWDAAWRMASERPIFGWGPDSFYGNYARFRSPAEGRQHGLALTDTPQNIFLGWATSTGFVGLLTYLALVGSALWLLATRMGRLSPQRRTVGACFGAGLVAYLAQGLYSIDVPPLALMGWICLAGIAVLLRDGDQQPLGSPEDAGRRPTDLVTYVVVGLVVLALAAFFVVPLRADHAAWAAERSAEAGWSQETMDFYEKAMALHPYEAGYKGLAAFYLERVAGDPKTPFSLEQALGRSSRLYAAAARLQPGNVYFLINSARVYQRLGTEVDEKHFVEADKLMSRAVTLDPFDPQLHDLYESLLERWAQAVDDPRVKQETMRRAETQAALARQQREGRAVG